MIIKVHLPEGEQLLEEGTLLCWKVKEGDQVGKGAVLAEIETPKAVVELESPAAGVVTRLLLQEGSVFSLKDPVAIIDASTAAKASHEGSKGRDAGLGRGWEKVVGAEPEARIHASPAARRLAREKGIDLSQISGSGPEGRIQESDVLAWVAPETGTGTASDAAATEDKIVPLSPMRRAIAGKLTTSKQTIPHFYLTIKVDAGSLWEAYTMLKAKTEVSLNDFVIRAAAAALKEFPEVNSSFQGDRQVFKHEINIGIAVHVAEGLRIPVIRNTDRLTLAEISRTAVELVRKAREGKVEGAGQGTFTVSNLGMFDISEFAAVINPPEAAVLAVGKVSEEAVVRNGLVTPGRTLSLTLSCDHRAFDGVTGAGFLKRIKEILEKPFDGAAG